MSVQLNTYRMTCSQPRPQHQVSEVTRLQVPVNNCVSSQVTSCETEWKDKPSHSPGVVNTAFEHSENGPLPVLGPNNTVLPTPGGCREHRLCNRDALGDGIKPDTECRVDVPDEEVGDAQKDEEEEGVLVRGFRRLQKSLCNHAGRPLRLTAYGLLLALYAGYVGYALSVEFGSEASVRLLWMTCFAAFCAIVYLIKRVHSDVIHKAVCAPIARWVSRHFIIYKWIFIGLVIVGLLSFIVVEVGIRFPINLVSLSGMAIYVLLLFVTSTNPAKVRWRPVLWGLGLQFIFAVLVLRTDWGYVAFKWLGDRVQEFMSFSDAGSKFVFGEKFTDHFFAFKVLPVVVFFSSSISVLYHLGWMQVVIHKIAWLMQRVLGTTAAESVNAAGNIFIGQTEAPLLIRPLIRHMTTSELHAVMVGGFATIAGSIMASYIAFGVAPNHLITASIMAAPCALALSKLSYPETRRSRTTSEQVSGMEAAPQQNLIEAASAGASAAIPLVANIAVNLMAFIALLEFVNQVLTWCGHRVGLQAPHHPELTFQLICSYLLWPFAFITGVYAQDCRKVAQLIGIKTFLNEFVAFTQLGKFIDNTNEFNDYQVSFPNGTYRLLNDDLYLTETNSTLVGGIMQQRSITIATYALCGFANISSIGSVMGALGSMVPDRKPEIAQIAVRAMLVGTVVSLMNGCTAGLLFTESADHTDVMLL